MRNAIVAMVATALVALTSCAQGSPIPPILGTIAPMAGGTDTTSSAPVTEASTSPKPSGLARQVTVLGVIRAGALPGCNTLVTESGAHYVLLDVTDPPRNIPVEVVGVLDPALVSYCNSGQPLHVQRISRR